MARKRTQAQIDAEKRRGKSPGRVVAARLNEEEDRAFEAARPKGETPSAFARALIRQALRLNTPRPAKRRRAKPPS